MNEIEKRNHPLGLEETRFKVSKTTLPSTNYMTPEFASPHISANTFRLPNASTSMNQAQSYCPASTAPFHAQNQNNSRTEVSGTTEVLEVGPEHIVSGNAANAANAETFPADFNGGSQ
ncbi:hypothetical protein EV2_011424 [Malus domestica]